MKKLILTLATLGLIHNAQAEIVEGNVTIQYKLTRQIPLAETATSVTYKQSVTSYKNADFIQKMGEIRGTAFSKKAKLMFVSAGSPSVQYFIRDGETDFNVTDRLNINQGIDGEAVNVMKGKALKGSPMTGTLTNTSAGAFYIAIAEPNMEDMVLQGKIDLGVRLIKSKEDTSVSVPILTYTIKGFGQFVIDGDPDDAGLIEGTVKLSGAKVLPTPTAPPEN